MVELMRVSLLSGNVRVRQVNATERQIAEIMAQAARPEGVSEQDREFILNGTVEHEWRTLKRSAPHEPKFWKY